MKKILGCAAAVLLLAACSDGNERLFKQAQLATSKGNYTQAMQLYSRLLKQDPKNASALANRGILWERLLFENEKERAKNRAYAEQDYLKAIEANPNIPEIYNNLGALYIDMGRYVPAVYYLSDAISLNPKYFTALMNRAIAYFRMGRVTDSLADFNRAFRIRQDEPLLYLNRGLAYFASGQYELALDDYTYLISLTPDDARPYLERARAFIKAGYPAQAYADLEEAVSIKPTYALAYYYMGDLMFRRGETDYALGLLVKSKELASQYVPTYDLMGDMLSVEDPVAATANYMVAKKLDPANAAKYDRKIKLMRTEEGRQRVLAERFFPN